MIVNVISIHFQHVIIIAIVQLSGVVHPTGTSKVSYFFCYDQSQGRVDIDP